MEDTVMLEQFGLTKTEAEVYVALLKIGSTKKIITFIKPLKGKRLLGRFHLR